MPQEPVIPVYNITFTRASESASSIPAVYRQWVADALTLYGDDDYTGLFFAEYTSWVTVGLMFSDFVITQYEQGTTEYSAYGLWLAVYDKSMETWTSLDYRSTESSGGNYIRNIRFSTNVIYFSGIVIYNAYIVRDFLDPEEPSSRNTWEDWKLVFVHRPCVNPPEIRVEYLSIPGRDGAIDYSSILSGHANINSRVGKWELKLSDNLATWGTVYTDMLSFLNGHRMKIQLSTDGGTYYGRLSIDSFENVNGGVKITIGYVIEVPGSAAAGESSGMEIITKTVTDNGVYYAVSDGADGYGAVTVNVPIPQAILDQLDAINGEVI